MTARMRRLASDYAQVKKDFAGHKNIIVTPIGEEPPERYHVTYFVNGIYLAPDGQVMMLSRHEVEITLHSDYPRYKPICRILTPIYHPNFRDGQICIGDIWGAGESLSDIIVNIGHMIQYKSWNSFSPLSAEAAQWAIENKHLFPVGNVDLYITDYASANQGVEIDLFDEEPEAPAEEAPAEEAPAEEAPAEELPADVTPAEEAPAQVSAVSADGNDFEITAEELEGIEFVPTAQRMQSINRAHTVKGGKINFKTILVKGLMWALIGSLIGFFISEFVRNVFSDATIADMYGYTNMANWYRYDEMGDEAFDKAYTEYETYCKRNNLDPNNENNFSNWYQNQASDYANGQLELYLQYDGMADDAFASAFQNDFGGNENAILEAGRKIQRTSTAIWSAAIALFIGLFLGIGEGVFYGSKEKALKYALIGAGISLVIGAVSGFLAQWMYADLLTEDATDFASAFVRGIGWALMGLGIGVAAGLIKPESKRILFCSLGGLGGGFVGGFLFNYVCDIIPNDVVARGVAIVIMGGLIGVGVGLLEQFAKQAWLKVIRGEFEGKEYLVFDGVTSIGNNGKNTIVLFKDKLVGPHHCDITLQGSRYILTDCGTPMGTVVNGRRVEQHQLRQGDTIAVGNSVLVFNTK